MTFTKAGSAGKRKGHRVVLYGTGGIGKTILAAQAPGPVGFYDLDESLDVLERQMVDLGIPIPLRIPCDGWTGVRQTLQSSGWDEVASIVVDTGTKLEEMSTAHTLRVVPTESGKRAEGIEGYGYGKGYQHNFETFLPILGDLDRHVREGRNVIIVVHECTSTVPNPKGEDWIRYEPRLQSPASGKASIRLRVKEWADHVLFMGYDVNVEKGKGEGQGTRTLYCSELPSCMAKSRTCSGNTFDVRLGEGQAIWKAILG